MFAPPESDPGLATASRVPILFGKPVLGVHGRARRRPVYLVAGLKGFLPFLRVARVSLLFERGG